MINKLKSNSYIFLFLEQFKYGYVAMVKHSKRRFGISTEGQPLYMPTEGHCLTRCFNSKKCFSMTMKRYNATHFECLRKDGDHLRRADKFTTSVDTDHYSIMVSFYILSQE